MTTVARSGFADVLRHRQFAVLYAAESQSILGDQLGRVALSVLVFRATGSIATTAVTYAATFLPAIAGGLLVAGVGDRLSHRAAMVLADVIRAVLFCAMAVPGLPLPVLLVLVVLAVAVGPLFTAAEVSRLSVALDAEPFRVAAALRLATSQVAQVVGFAVGGVLIAVLSPRGALLANGLTFALSAVLIGCLLPLQARPSTAAGAPVSVSDAVPMSLPDGRSDTADPPGRDARRVLWSRRDLRFPLAMTLLAGFFIVPEGLAVPIGDEIGAASWQTGLLLAAIPFGGVVGAIVLARLIRPARRRPVSWAMAAVAGLPLVVSALTPAWWAIAALWAVSGLFTAYQIEVTSGLVASLPETSRAKLVGVVGAGLTGAQGLGVVLFGAMAQLTGALPAVAAAGAIGVILGTLVRRALTAPGASESPTDRAAPSI